VDADKCHGIMKGYKLSFYEWTNESFQSLKNRTYEPSVLHANFSGLKLFTKYKIEVLGFNDFGEGPRGAVEVYTDEACQ